MSLSCTSEDMSAESDRSREKLAAGVGPVEPTIRARLRNAMKTPVWRADPYTLHTDSQTSPAKSPGSRSPSRLTPTSNRTPLLAASLSTTSELRGGRRRTPHGTPSQRESVNSTPVAPLISLTPGSDSFDAIALYIFPFSGDSDEKDGETSGTVHVLTGNPNSSGIINNSDCHGPPLNVMPSVSFGSESVIDSQANITSFMLSPDKHSSGQRNKNASQSLSGNSLPVCFGSPSHALRRAPHDNFLFSVLDTGRAGCNASKNATSRIESGCGGGDHSAMNETNGYTQVGLLHSSSRPPSLLPQSSTDRRRSSVVVVDPNEEASLSHPLIGTLFDIDVSDVACRRSLSQSLSGAERERDRSPIRSQSISGSHFGSAGPIYGEAWRPSCINVSLLSPSPHISEHKTGTTSITATPLRRDASHSIQRCVTVLGSDSTQREHSLSATPSTRGMMRMYRALLPSELAEDPDKPTFTTVTAVTPHWARRDGDNPCASLRGRRSSSRATSRASSVHDDNSGEIPLDALPEPSEPSYTTGEEEEVTLTSLTASTGETPTPVFATPPPPSVALEYEVPRPPSAARDMNASAGYHQSSIPLLPVPSPYAPWRNSTGKDDPLVYRPPAALHGLSLSTSPTSPAAPQMTARADAIHGGPEGRIWIPQPPLAFSFTDSSSFYPYSGTDSRPPPPPSPPQGTSPASRQPLPPPPHHTSDGGTPRQTFFSAVHQTSSASADSVSIRSPTPPAMPHRTSPRRLSSIVNVPRGACCVSQDAVATEHDATSEHSMYLPRSPVTYTPRTLSHSHNSSSTSTQPPPQAVATPSGASSPAVLPLLSRSITQSRTDTGVSYSATSTTYPDRSLGGSDRRNSLNVSSGGGTTNPSFRPFLSACHTHQANSPFLSSVNVVGSVPRPGSPFPPRPTSLYPSRPHSPSAAGAATKTGSNPN